MTEPSTSPPLPDPQSAHARRDATRAAGVDRVACRKSRWAALLTRRGVWLLVVAIALLVLGALFGFAT